MSDTDDHRFAEGIRRIGYGITVAINLGILWIANNLLEWGWFSWLTEDFETVLPWLNASLVATVISQAIYLFRDEPSLKRPVDMVANGVSLLATIQLWRVFPFDFSDYAFNWAVMVRVILGLAIFGMSIGLIVSLTTMLRTVVVGPSEG